ncbi:MAG: hypothetical protein ACT4PT_02935 [Methanobacteriota archaeon]
MQGRGAVVVVAMTLAAGLYVVAEAPTARALFAPLVCATSPNGNLTNGTNLLRSNSTGANASLNGTENGWLATSFRTAPGTMPIKINVSFFNTEFPYHNAVDIRIWQYTDSGQNNEYHEAAINGFGFGTKLYLQSDTGFEDFFFEETELSNGTRTWACNATLHGGTRYQMLVGGASDHKVSVKIEIEGFPVNPVSCTGCVLGPNNVNVTTGNQTFMFKDEDFDNGTLNAGYQESAFGSIAPYQAKGAVDAWKTVTTTSCCLHAFFIAEGTPGAVRIEGGTTNSVWTPMASPAFGRARPCHILLGCFGNVCLIVEGGGASTYKFTALAHADAFAGPATVRTGMCTVDGAAGQPVFPGGLWLMGSVASIPALPP